MDMLVSRVPIDKIIGMVVLQAHQVLPTSTEAFIMRLYRHANRVGFVKAFSDDAAAFVAGFNNVEKVSVELVVCSIV